MRVWQITLNDEEAGWLKKMLADSQEAGLGLESEAEFGRLLLHREWNRRHDLPQPESFAFRTAARIGRPVEQKTTVSQSRLP